MSDLPANWGICRLGDHIEIAYGRGLPESHRDSSGNIPVYGSNGVVGQHTSAITNAPVIIIGRKGSAGAVHFCSTPCWPIDTTFYIDSFPPNIDAKYLGFFLQTQHLADLNVHAAIPGIRREALYDLMIPHPFPDNPERSLAEQRRIVARVEALLAEVREIRKLQGRISADSNELLQAARREVFGIQPESDWVSLSTYVRFIENGRSPQAQNRPAEGHEWGVLKVGAVTYGYFKSDENKALLPDTEPRIQFEVRQGDFLMSRANTLALVGACALVKEVPPPRLLISDKTFRFHFRDDPTINAVYLDHVLKSPALRAQIEKVASGTSPTMKNISKEKVLSLLVPKHSPREQDHIASYFELISAEVEEMRSMNQEDTKLLSMAEQAILTQAFHGEL